ncbi:UDP-GlcNAc:undecaprenyl-phosphate GlcNAc-1-phosphate transferase [Microcella putealis]|uniref:UDP-GlcNAc:undecaprenyl-phosphate GlcNAc-1-phosphate transferase n=1 Tax=Microcella putealis TaxID=337005 RepID=A0A4Q7LX90_9MICO|nr:MraY family glycosyltransferase [Microcella putealis]RZS59173.1 UDP-GlcNAc:undecaprenyl-phosphate GlcNAc-1-phosphate transferase [Microcella putealis]TQM24199.1 UDP-GlcNAc:undecaprenyl-phosphate GlcNAc-1-phosphate transferase [Microcella putealis]
MRFLALVAVIAAVVSFLGAWALVLLSRRFKLYPGIRDRDVHTRPTPRLGGIAIVTGVLIGTLAASQISWFAPIFTDPWPVIAIAAAALIMLAIGVVDDFLDLDWITKLAGQLLIAGFLAWSGVQIVSLPVGPGEGISVLSPTQSLIITILAVVLVMNAVNFIDGLDGLVAGVTLIAGGVFFAYSYILAITTSQSAFNLASMIMAVLLGATLGFLPFNWHPAKIFMGDGGALVIGMLMAVSTVTVTGQIEPASIGTSQFLPAFIPLTLPFAVLIVPLLDFGLAVLRRLRAGKSPFSADRMHLHHRLLDMGHSHFHAVLIFYAWTAVIAIGTLAFMFVDWRLAVGGIAGGLIVCAIVTLAPLSRRKRVESAAQRDPYPDENLARYDPLDAAAPAIDREPDPRDAPIAQPTKETRPT